MAQRHNQWMKILSTVFSFLSSLLGSMKFPTTDASSEAASTDAASTELPSSDATASTEAASTAAASPEEIPSDSESL